MSSDQKSPHSIRKPSPFERMREAAIASGEYVQGAPTIVVEDQRSRFAQTQPDIAAKIPMPGVVATVATTIPRGIVKPAEGTLSLHGQLGLSRPRIGVEERAANDARELLCQRNLTEARDKRLIPQPIWDVLPPLHVPNPKPLLAAMTLQGQVERLIRAYRGVCYRRFGKYPTGRFTAKQVLGSTSYGDLFRTAVAALLETQVAPIQWVDWSVHQWVKLKFKDNFQWAKIPTVQSVFHAPSIIAMRHTVRAAVGNKNQLNQDYYGPLAKELLEKATRQERQLSSFLTVESLVAFWQASELGQQWVALLEAATLEQFQQQQVWESKLALGEWIDEWP